MMNPTDDPVSSDENQRFEAVQIDEKQEGISHRKKKSTIQYTRQDAKYKITVILLGESEVGKTSMISRYFDNEFHRDQDRTQGIAPQEKIISILDDIIQYRIMDTAGHERHSFTLGGTYYKKADGCLLVFDVTNRESFIKIKKWLNQFREFGRDNTITFLIATKMDKIYNENQKRQVTEQEAEQFIKDNNIKKYYETSSLTGHGISSVFQTMAAYILQYHGDNVKMRSDVIYLDSQPGATNKPPSGCKCALL